jgi:putative addiction module component (TIGR02574 family)
MNTLEISKMSTVERLQAMEALWDSLIHEETEPESPKWHQDALDARSKKIAEGKAEFISLKELKSKMRGRN